MLGFYKKSEQRRPQRKELATTSCLRNGVQWAVTIRRLLNICSAPEAECRKIPPLTWVWPSTFYPKEKDWSSWRAKTKIQPQRIRPCRRRAKTGHAWTSRTRWARSRSSQSRRSKTSRREAFSRQTFASMAVEWVVRNRRRQASHEIKIKQSENDPIELVSASRGWSHRPFRLWRKMPRWRASRCWPVGLSGEKNWKGTRKWSGPSSGRWVCAGWIAGTI